MGIKDLFTSNSPSSNSGDDGSYKRVGATDSGGSGLISGLITLIPYFVFGLVTGNFSILDKGFLGLIGYILLGLICFIFTAGIASKQESGWSKLVLVVVLIGLIYIPFSRH